MKAFGTIGRLALTAVSCLILWAYFERAYQANTTSSSRPPALIYVVTAPGPDARNPATLSNEIWLTEVKVDGAVIPLKELERTGAWEDRSFALVHRNDPQPATVRVRGGDVELTFMESAWSGIATVESNSGSRWTLDLYHERSEENVFQTAHLADNRLVSQHATDDWPRPRLNWAFVAVLLAALACRPWRTLRLLSIWMFGYLVALHLLVWLSQEVGFNSDAIGYEGGILAAIFGYVTFFPPGYSLFIAPWALVAPQAMGFAVAGTQHLCMVLTLYAIWQMTRPVLGDHLALVALLLAGSLAPTLFLPQMLFSENAALFGMTGALWFAFRSRPQDRPRRDLFAGLFASLATLARVVPLAAIVLPLGLLYFRSEQNLRASLRRTVRVLAVVVAVCVLFATWNFVNTRHFSLSNGSGRHLYNRVITQQMLIDRSAPATRRLLALLGDQPLDGVGHWDIHSIVQARGLSYDDAADLMGAVAVEGLRTDLVGFERYSMRQSWREYGAIPYLQAGPNSTDPIAAFQSPIPMGVRTGSIAWGDRMWYEFASAWPYLLWAPIIGLLAVFLLEERLVFLSLLAVPAGYLLATAQVEYFLERYVVCVLPFALMLVPAPLAAVAGLWRRVRARS